jgi:hypothetical protein
MLLCRRVWPQHHLCRMFRPGKRPATSNPTLWICSLSTPSLDAERQVGLHANCSFLLFDFNLNWNGSTNNSVLPTVKQIVTYILIARQRLGKHIPALGYARNNRTSIARQRISKQAFSAIKRLGFLRGPCQGVIKGQKGRLRELLSKVESSFETPAWQDMSWGAEELN